MPRWAERLLLTAWLLLLGGALALAFWQAENRRDLEAATHVRHRSAVHRPVYKHCLREHNYRAPECEELLESLTSRVED